jgi:hypothetical protein
VGWQVILHHGNHIHPLGSGTGTSGSFDVPDHGDDSFLELKASASDSRGAVSTTQIGLDPQRATVSVGSTPKDGVTLYVDGAAHATPYSWQAIVGGAHSLTAPASVTVNGSARSFAAWLQGSSTVGTAVSYGFVTPTGPLALTASYGAR